MKFLEVLKKMRVILSSPDKWCQRVSSLDKEGKATDPTSGNANRYCIGGALIKAMNETPDQDVTLETITHYAEILTKFIMAASYKSGPRLRIAYWNDDQERTFDHVAELLDRAIASLEKQEQNPTNT